MTVTRARAITGGLYPHLEVESLVEGRREIAGVFREPGGLGAVVEAVDVPYSIVRSREGRCRGEGCRLFGMFGMPKSTGRGEDRGK